MPYVITQACCADASCVQACPVNCIHPTPGEPGFAEAEMLYVDPGGCVDCGACATACPVDAAVPHTALTDAQQPFRQLNADYYDVFGHRDRAPVAVQGRQRRLRASTRRRVAVVGAGPAGLYAADELLRHPEVTVDVYDRLPTPYGLLRSGVAPDHPHTKRAAELFRQIEEQPGFRYFLGVEVGPEASADLTLADLSAQYDAVVYAVGAADDRWLAIEGEHLPGSSSATDFVGWYNGHPDKQGEVFPLDHERAVVIGNGNVALDVARILTLDPQDLDHTDLARLAWAALLRSDVREVVVLGRRGAIDAAFTMPELIGLAGADLNVTVDWGGPVTEETAKTRLLAEIASRPHDPTRRTIVLRFHTRPQRILGADGRVTGLEVERGGIVETIDAGLVLRAIGYHGRPVADLPYDATTGTVPNQGGRVHPGVYVVGWIKRGPTGFIGTNKSCAEQTVAAILDDFDAELTEPPVGTAASVAAVVAGRQPEVIDLAGWRAIDAEEQRRGAAAGRPRTKIVDVAEMRRVARTAASPPAGSAAGGRAGWRRYAATRRT